MKRIVFAGPSLFGVAPEELAGIDLRPPAGKGDLLAAALEGAAMIGLVDGTFEFGAATWHKEILFAINRGVVVFGAASMGALRAAECADFGMKGIGQVFAEFATGRRTADADVALAHAPADLQYRPLTEALVDIEATLERLATSGKLPVEESACLLRTAQGLHFKERSWPIMVRRAGLSDPDHKLSLIRAHRVSVKTADALAMIRAMRETTGHMPATSASIPFNHTMFFDELFRDVQQRGS